MTAVLVGRIVVFTMEEFEGISASPGIAIGPAFYYVDDTPTIPRYSIESHQIDSEMERYFDAISKAKDEIESLKRQSHDEIGEEHVRFLDTHVLMLQDPEFTQNMEEKLNGHKRNVEWVFYRQITDMMGKLAESSDDYLRERTVDIEDVSRRVLNHLVNRERVSLADLDRESILITHDLLPSDAIAMDKRMVKGIAMDAGGKTSHTAILARAFEIPAVLGLSNVSEAARAGAEIIVDGNRGKVIVEPDAETRERYQAMRDEWHRHEVQMLKLNDLPAETRDGKLIALKANIEIPEEVDSVSGHGADGVGLFRSEFLFLQPGKLPSEDEQVEAYSHVLRAMGSKPVTIRTLDVGGDKVVPEFKDFSERNPILGWRAIRFCLSHTDVFKTQLRALLRSSVEGTLQIMFPMISGIEELNAACEVLEEVKDELRRAGIAFDEDVPVGIMIEVPSAAMTADLLARKVSFFSIGTNDLIQYTIAVDRGNERIAYLYEPFHPGVLRLIKLIIESGHDHGIPVGMCGEMAGDPTAAVILLGLGLDEFSMGSVGIPEVKQIVRAVSMGEAEDIVGDVLEMRSYVEIENYMRKLMEDRFSMYLFA